MKHDTDMDLIGQLWFLDKHQEYPPVEHGKYAVACVDSMARWSNLDMDTRLLGIPTPGELEHRFADGNALYMIVSSQDIVAFGWVCRHRTSFGQSPVVVPPHGRYLWDFATLPEFRGRGLYPLLLRSIVHREHARHFWIIHHISNRSSARGIEKAGFRNVADIVSSEPGKRMLRIPQENDVSAEASTMLGISVVQD